MSTSGFAGFLPTPFLNASTNVWTSDMESLLFVLTARGSAARV
jgi:hypothetical protein